MTFKVNDLLITALPTGDFPESQCHPVSRLYSITGRQIETVIELFETTPCVAPEALTALKKRLKGAIAEAKKRQDAAKGHLLPNTTGAVNKLAKDLKAAVEELGAVSAKLSKKPRSRMPK